MTNMIKITGQHRTEQFCQVPNAFNAAASSGVAIVGDIALSVHRHSIPSFITEIYAPEKEIANSRSTLSSLFPPLATSHACLGSIYQRTYCANF